MAKIIILQSKKKYDNLKETRWSLRRFDKVKDTFFRLSDEKKMNLINACTEEFAKNTYDSTSLNVIIAQAKISKGGLFKYIESKRDLYMYLIHGIMKNVIEYQSRNIDLSKTCYFDRINALLSDGLGYYKKHKLEFKVMMNAFYDLASPCYEEVMEIRSRLINTHQSNLLEKIDWSQYKENKENILKVSKYMIDGYNLALLKRLDQYDYVEELEADMKIDLEVMLNAIKKGVKG